MTSAPRSVAVLGGGITGLSAAHRLAQRGVRVRLFEQSGRLGGAIRTERTGGWLIEAGPNSIAETPELARLIRDVGLESERIEAAPAARNRYLVRQGRLVPLPLSPRALLSTPLLSPAGRLRVVLEAFRRPRERAAEVSVAQFVRDHFGEQALRAAAQPIVSGIYAGDPERLSAREAFPRLWEVERRSGSLLRAMRTGSRAGEGAPKMISFRGGLQVLSDAIAAALPPGTVVLESAVRRLAGPPWEVRPGRPAGGADPPFDAVISALPAQALAGLAIGAAGDAPFAAMASIPHPPLASFFIGYPRDAVRHALDGFGLLVPFAEKRSILGVLFSSSLFPGRAPEGHVALTVMAGGSLQPEAALQPAPELYRRIAADLGDLLGVTGEPAFARHHLWPRAIPQYDLGHARHRHAAEACERAHPGLFIGGQAISGISVGQCVSAGFALADRALASGGP